MRPRRPMRQSPPSPVERERAALTGLRAPLSPWPCDEIGEEGAANPPRTRVESRRGSSPSLPPSRGALRWSRGSAAGEALPRFHHRHGEAPPRHRWGAGVGRETPRDEEESQGRDRHLAPRRIRLPRELLRCALPPVGHGAASRDPCWREGSASDPPRARLRASRGRRSAPSRGRPAPRRRAQPSRQVEAGHRISTPRTLVRARFRPELARATFVVTVTARKGEGGWRAGGGRRSEVREGGGGASEVRAGGREKGAGNGEEGGDKKPMWAQ
jgi:hypothetical protein